MSEREAIAYIERRISSMDSRRAAGGFGGTHDHWREEERPLLVTCLAALRAAQEQAEPLTCDGCRYNWFHSYKCDNCVRSGYNNDKYELEESRDE